MGQVQVGAGHDEVEMQRRTGHPHKMRLDGRSGQSAVAADVNPFAASLLPRWGRENSFRTHDAGDDADLTSHPPHTPPPTSTPLPPDLVAVTFRVRPTGSAPSLRDT